MRDFMRKFAFVLCVFFMAFGLYAQKAKTTGLTDSDVKSFAENYQEIIEKIESLDLDEGVFSPKSKPYASLNTALSKLGISGPDQIMKVNMITQCMALIYAENEYGQNSEYMQIMNSLGLDPFAEMRNNLNDKDYNVVLRNYDTLAEAMGLMIDDSSVDDGVFGWDDFDDGGEYWDNFDDDGYDYDFGLFTIRGDWEKRYEEDYDLVKGIEGKLTSSKKDVGMLYKKYDPKNAKKYSLVASYVSSDSYADHGIGFIWIDSELEETGNLVSFTVSPDGFVISYTDFTDPYTEYAYDKEIKVYRGKIKVSKWEIYANDDYSCHELVLYTDKAGIIHVYSNYNEDFAILVNGGCELEGSMYWSAG